MATAAVYRYGQGNTNTNTEAAFAASYDTFMRKFQALILEGKSSDADQLLFANKQFASILLKRGPYETGSPFDCQLEYIVQDTTNPKRYIRAAQLCSILENQGYATRYSRMYHACCLVKVGNLKDAKDCLKQQNYPWISMRVQIQTHTEIVGHEDIVDLYTAGDEFTQKAIKVEQFCAGLEKLIFIDKFPDIGAFAAAIQDHFKGHEDLYPTFEVLEPFDAIVERLETVVNSITVNRRDQILALVGFLKENELVSEYSKSNHIFQNILSRTPTRPDSHPKIDLNRQLIKV